MTATWRGDWRSGGSTLGGEGAPRRNPVLWVLVVLMAASAVGLPWLCVAANRLVDGTGVPLREVLHGPRWMLVGLWVVLAVCAARAPARRVQVAVVVTAAALLTGLIGLAGLEAARRTDGGTALSRVSLGGGGWAMVLLLGLAVADALRRSPLSTRARVLAHLAVWLPVGGLLASGALSSLSLLKEYAVHRSEFRAAAIGHLQIVVATLVPALTLGVPLGVACARRARLRAWVVPVLNVVQTVPSIALFGLLIAPLGAFGAAFPALGVRGIGLAPAVIALTAYALLPVVHATSAGLRQVPAAVIDAATGMGFTPRQRFWRVQVPLAWPTLLAGLRVTTVQVIGGAVVAALIGAGGFGALVFQGLLGSALDLVMLGVLPVVALSLLADAALGLLAGAARRPSP